MTFIIKCTNCGNEREITDASKPAVDKNISIETYNYNNQNGESMRSIMFDCKNSDCRNNVDMEA